MKDRAAELFDEFFRRNNIPRHRRRHDLSSLNPALRRQLRAIQQSFNFSLKNEKQGILGHVPHPPFHIDYVDADVESATAFRYAGHSFIAVAVSLMYSMSDVCLALSKSPEVAQALGVQHSSDDYNQLHGVMFSILSGFIIAHEYTHHVYGHLSEEDPANLFLGISPPISGNGSFQLQVDELVADGYAIYHVLTNTVVTSKLNGHNPFYALNADGGMLSDEQLFATVVITLTGYFLTLPEVDLTPIKIYALDHPPPPARVNSLMHEATGWSRQNRPDLEGFLAHAFQKLIGTAAQAALGDKANQIWNKQNQFLQSSAGAIYIRALIAGVNKFRESIPT